MEQKTLVFELGERVVLYPSEIIGVITKISPKRGDITVDFGNFKQIFRKDGWDKHGDVWNSSYIKPCTLEIEEEIRNKAIIRKCVNCFKTTPENLTADKALRIMEILFDE